ncbi:MAG: radical SAM protein with 4Fe4S-binding SPASM domain [Cognaticolwellia sp.]|jgi:radical SAM protein with 4Fe4S-binding SPASM domain
MTTTNQESLHLKDSLEAVQSWIVGLPQGARQPMAARWQALQVRLEAQGGAEALFLGAEGSPAFVLLGWLGDGLDSTQLDLERAGIAMLALYFSVRIQDDLVDANRPRQEAYLQQLMTGWASALLGDVPGAAQDWQSVMGAFAAAALEDLSWRSHALPWTERAMSLQGDKYLPVVLPLLWLARRAQRPELCEPLIALVRTLGRPLQLTNDLLGAARDLEEGQRSAYLAVMELDPREHGVADLASAERRSWNAGPLRAFVERIDRELGHVALLAGGFGWGPELETHLGLRRSALSRRALRLSTRAAFGGQYLMADIELTRRCNLRCPDCFVFAQEPDMSRLDELDPSFVMALLEELSGYRTDLHLTGGEPFFYPAIWEVLEAADRLGFSKIMINTNGGLLGEEELARLGALRASVHLMVSIDGPPGVHERVRGQTQTEKALRALRLAPQHGVSATPASILTGDLLDFGVAAWGDWLAERIGGWRDLTLWPLFVAPDAVHDGAGRPLSTEDLDRTARQCASLHHQGLRVVVADYPVVNPMLQHYGVPKELLWQCTAGVSRICVQADRSVTPCHPFRRSLAQVDPYNVRGFVQRALGHPDALAMGARNHTGCGSCEHKSVCGNCQAAVVGLGHPLGGNDARCQDALALLDGEPLSALPIEEIKPPSTERCDAS